MDGIYLEFDKMLEKIKQSKFKCAKKIFYWSNDIIMGMQNILQMQTNRTHFES